jgi:serine/threonine protein kinase/tetratricopeptide (TPR) repeat protein
MTFDRIGKYEIVGKLGQGAMGLVHKAWDPILNRHVAIKTMTAESGADEELRKRFQREAQSAAQLNHPNIITVYDFGEEDGRAYMAMELLQGNDLKNLIGNTSVTLDEKLSVMEQVLDGLAFAHEMHVVHRDLKPANIHILPNGQVKIMDFGLARLGSSDITKTGMVMGTPNYMSPEQVRGERVDERSDIFSIGAVFYELLTVHKPFHADSMHAVLFQVLENDPEPPRRWVPNLPPVLVDLVEKALAKDPADRFQHTTEMLEAVRQARLVIPPDVANSSMVLADQTAPTLSSDRPRSDPGSGSGSGRTGLSVSRRGRTALGSRMSPVPAPSRTAKPADLPPTLLGQAPTQMEAALRSGRGPLPGQTTPSGGHRSPLMLAAGGLGLLLVAGGAVWMMRPRAEGKPDTTGAQVGALKGQLLSSQLQLSQKAFDGKDYKNALSHAQEALKVDPGSAEARQAEQRAREALAALEATATAAREALDAGDYASAARGLEQLLSLDPNHPAAADLSSRLNGHFRSQANDARRSARDAQAAAEKARARSLPDYSAAASAARDGESAFGRGEYAVAARKWLDARDGFERARREVESATPPPTTLPPTTTLATPPPTTQPPVTQPPATQPPATTPPTTAPPPTQPPPVNEEPAIRRTVTEYGRAIEQKDLALFRRLKPNLTKDEEHRLKAAFDAAPAERVHIEIEDLKVAGSRATVRLTRQDTIGGQAQTIQQTLVLVKGAGGWTIQEIGR